MLCTRSVDMVLGSLVSLDRGGVLSGEVMTPRLGNAVKTQGRSRVDIQNVDTFKVSIIQPTFEFSVNL